MALENNTVHLNRGEIKDFNAAVGLHNHSSAPIKYSFKPFEDETRKGLTLLAYADVKFPSCQIYVKSEAHSADVEIIKDI